VSADGRPAVLAGQAAEAVRALNHATLPGTGRLVFPADAYDVTGQLALLAARLPQAEASLYASITGGQLEVASLDRDDWERIRELVTTYADLRLGGTDASVITLAERLGATRIATLNHRHFTVVRPRHAEAFELLP